MPSRFLNFFLEFVVTSHEEDTVVNTQSNQHDEAEEWSVPSKHASAKNCLNNPLVDWKWAEVSNKQSTKNVNRLKKWTSYEHQSNTDTN